MLPIEEYIETSIQKEIDVLGRGEGAFDYTDVQGGLGEGANKVLLSAYSVWSEIEIYKPCDYVIKTAQTRPITCGKPILKSSIPVLRTVHLQKAQKYLHRAGKKVKF